MFSNRNDRELHSNKASKRNRNSRNKDANSDETNPNPCRLFVGGFQASLLEDDLIKYFSKFGKIQRGQVMYEKSTGKSRSFGFIECCSFQIAQAILSTKHVINGRDIDVNYAFQKNNKKSVNNWKRILNEKKLFITNLSPSTSSKSLRKYFHKFGEIRKAYIITDPLTNRSKRFGYVEFFEKASLDETLMDQHHFFDGASVLCFRYKAKQDESCDSMSYSGSHSPVKSSRGDRDRDRKRRQRKTNDEWKSPSPEFYVKKKEVNVIQPQAVKEEIKTAQTTFLSQDDHKKETKEKETVDTEFDSQKKRLEFWQNQQQQECYKPQRSQYYTPPPKISPQFDLNQNQLYPEFYLRHFVRTECQDLGRNPWNVDYPPISNFQGNEVSFNQENTPNQSQRNINQLSYTNIRSSPGKKHHNNSNISFDLNVSEPKFQEKDSSHTNQAYSKPPKSSVRKHSEKGKETWNQRSDFDSFSVEKLSTFYKKIDTGSEETGTTSTPHNLTDYSDSESSEGERA